MTLTTLGGEIAVAEAATPPVALQDLEQKLHAADANWLKGSPKDAVPLYTRMLADLPAQAEPFRASLILRLARANHAAGDREASLEALRMLDGLEYLPEHHSLAAAELKTVLQGKPDPGLRHTPIPPVGPVAERIYVDANVGTHGSGSPQKPFGTLREALALARKARAGQPHGAIEILLATGTYRSSEPIELSGTDAGTQASPLVIRSANPAKRAVLSGGTVLRKWKAVSDPALLARLPEANRGKVLVCNLKENGIEEIGPLIFGGASSGRVERSRINQGNVSFPVPELFYSGEAQPMACWPNDGMSRIPVNETPNEPNLRSLQWVGEEDLWLHGYWVHDWSDAYEKVKSIDPTGNIAVEPPQNRYGFGSRTGRVLNALSELDQPGEWKLDTKNGLLYFYPPDSFDPALCVFSSYETPFSAIDCPFLQIRDLDVMNVRGDALQFSKCQDLIVADVSISNCSGLGIRIEGGKRHLVHSCRIEKMGCGGIDWIAGDWQKLESAESLIENCTISNLSRINRTYSPALRVEGMGIQIRHNAFFDIPSSAIRVEACDSLIELNSFRHCVFESNDQGAIDMWANPLLRGNVIRWNDFDQIVNNKARFGAAGVRHDDFISGFLVSENVFRKGSDHGFGAVQYNRGFDNYFEGNIIIDWQSAWSGQSATGAEWISKVTTHERSKKMLAETPWQSDAWVRKYPRVKDLLAGDNNHNYLISNQRFGSGGWGTVGNALTLGNVTGSADVHYRALPDVKEFVVPWNPIPVEEIGTYEARP